MSSPPFRQRRCRVTAEMASEELADRVVPSASVPMRLPWMRVPVEPAAVTITETPAPPLPEMTPPAPESRATDDIVGRAFDADAVTAVCDL